MSCDDNKDARQADKVKRRSLPIVTSEAPKEAPKYWRSIDELNRAKSIALGAVNEFAPGADTLEDLLRGSGAVGTVDEPFEQPRDRTHASKHKPVQPPSPSN